MKFAPFIVPGINQQSMPMGMAYHLVPDVHPLFFGPAECARHTFPGLVSDPDASLLVIDDVQTSLGKSEDLIREAVEEIIGLDPSVKAFVLCTACQTAFLGIDLEGLCTSLHDETGLYFAHVEANRMSADNIPGRERKQVPGGDRYHIRRAFMRMMLQAPHEEDVSRGIVVLSEEPLDSSNELLGYSELPNIDWVRSIGDCKTFEEFLELRHAVASIAVAPAWIEPQQWLEERFGIPGIYAPPSYSLKEIDRYYEQLDKMLVGAGMDSEQLTDVQEDIRVAREQARKDLRDLRDKLDDVDIDLDVRVIGRPFSLVEAMFEYGFFVRVFQPSYERIHHKEADDLPAFERLCDKIPGLDERFAAHQKSEKRKGANSSKRAGRSGRYTSYALPEVIEHVPEEVSWWGYASVRKLVDEMNNGLEKNHDTREALPMQTGKRMASSPHERFHFNPPSAIDLSIQLGQSIANAENANGTRGWQR